MNMGHARSRQPIVGILTSPKVTASLSRQENPLDCRSYAEAAAQLAVPLFVFSAADIDLDQGSASGWILDRTRGWVHQAVSWPDFVYDLAKGKAGQTAQAKLVKADSRMHWLNEIRSHRKWLTHQLLWPKFPDLLPRTILGRTAVDLKAMLNQYPAVLTKPTNGTWGNGICKIWRAADRSYTVQASNGDRGETGLSAAHALARAREVARGRKLIIQQALELLQINRRASDLRLMMGKDRLGNWQVLQWYIRVGRPDAFVTNCHNGGTAIDVIPGLLAAGIAPRTALPLA